MAAIFASLTFSGLIIHQFFEEAIEDPITVSLKNIRIEAVPFPAVTIDAKSTGINPLGFAQKFFDMLAFYDVNFESTFNEPLSPFLCIEMKSSDRARELLTELTPLAT